jgi:vacuolar-type H+-ATPase subunit D/Vma8
VSDDTSTLEFRALLSNKIDNLVTQVYSLERAVEHLKNGIGERVEKHADRLTSLETSVSILSKIAWVLFASSMGVVIAAFLKLVMK